MLNRDTEAAASTEPSIARTRRAAPLIALAGAGLASFSLIDAHAGMRAVLHGTALVPHQLYTSLVLLLTGLLLSIALCYPRNAKLVRFAYVAGAVGLLGSALVVIPVLANAFLHGGLWSTTPAWFLFANPELRPHTVPMLALLPMAVGILLLPLERRWGHRYGDWPVLLGLIIVQAGFLQLVLEPPRLDVYNHLCTLLSLTLLGAAVLVTEPVPGLFALHFRRGMGGAMVRRLLPVAFLLPTVLGVLRAYGEQQALFPTWVGALLGAVATTTLFTALVLFTASRLDAIDQRRRGALALFEEEQARFRSSFEHAAIGMCIVNLEGRFLEANRFLCTMLGYSEAELTTRCFQEVTHPEDLEADLYHVAQLVSGVIPSYQLEKRYLHRSGHAVWAMLSVSLVRDSSGAPLHFISQVQDLSQRKQAQSDLVVAYEALANTKGLLEATFNSTSEYIAALDLDFKVITCNRAFKERFFEEYQLEAMPGGTLPDMMAAYPGDQAAMAAMLQKAREGTSFIESSAFGNPARPRRTYELALAPIRGNDMAIMGVSIVARDISERLEHEAALRQREVRFRTLLELAPDGMLVLDAEGTIQLVNSQTEALFGYARSELIGQDVRMLFPARYRDRYPEVFFWALQQEGVQHLGESRNIRGLRRSGQEFLVEVNLSPIDNDGARCLVAAVRDVTERAAMVAALRDSEERLQIALESARVGTWVWTPATGTLAWDPQLGPLFGLAFGVQPHTYEEFTALLHPDDRMPYIQEAVASLESKEYFDSRFRVVWPDGTLRWLASHARVWRDAQGKPIRLAGACWDVSAERNHEIALQHAADELKRSNADLQQFAYAASHDLQEPLRAVAGCAQMLQMRYADALDEEGTEIIRHTVDGAKRMQTLIEDLLAYSRVGTRDIQLAEIPAEDSLREALLNLEVLLAESGAQVWIEPLPMVMADRGQLRQLFQHLISNAVKFAGTEPPRLVIRALRMEHGWEFQVQDHGIGIDATHAERIFQVFQRLHTRTAYAGTGIGLAICKRIVERHGGRIWFTSELGEGTTFCFTMGGPTSQETL